jgi:gliding motility-associated-like protein
MKEACRYRYFTRWILLIVFNLLLLFTHLANAQSDLQRGLLACYPFSGNADDVSGHNKNGTVNGAILTTDRFGNLNSAFSFNGLTNYIEIPVSSFLIKQYSYSLWAKPKSIPSEGLTTRMLSIGGPGGDQDASLGNSYVVVSRGWDGAGYNTDGTVTHYSTGNLPIADNWYYITVTRDETTIKLYINGILAGSDPTYGKTAYYGYNSPRAIIGSRSTLTQYFDGAIDDVRIYDRALTAEEVDLLYRAPDMKKITIQSTPDLPCAGSTVDFAITPAIGGDAIYQWKVDGIPVGNNSSTFSYTFPESATDYTRTISAEVYSRSSCATTTAQITLPFQKNATPSLTVRSDKDSTCAGEIIHFTATPTYGGSSPFYQWKINGVNQGSLTSSATFSTTFANSEQSYQVIVSVDLTSNAACATHTQATAQATVQVSPRHQPTVSLVGNDETCSDVPTLFAVSPPVPGATYQWKVNGVNQGLATSASSFQTSFAGNLMDDFREVEVDIQPNQTCLLPISLQKTVKVKQQGSYTISLSASVASACADLPITFTASPEVPGATYRWKIDGIDQGTMANSSIFIHSFPNRGAAYETVVSVEADLNQACTAPASNQIKVNIQPHPVLTCFFPESVEKNAFTQYIVQISGGHAPYTYRWVMGSDTISSNQKDTLTYTFEEIGKYDIEVSVTDHNGCQAVCQSTQIITRPLIIPNVFTPNGDSHNDTFTILYEENNFVMQIYNRWGQLIAKTDDGVRGWDGSAFPTGLYYYQIKIASKEYKGWVSLLR